MNRHVDMVAIAYRLVLMALAAVMAVFTVGCENREAMAEAKKLTDKFITKCGDSYYMQPNTITELKDEPKLSISSSDLSEVDHLNGYTWKGFAILKCTADRPKYVRTWLDWESHRNYAFEMYKVNGTWRYKPNQFVRDTPIDTFSPPKVPCESVTQ